MEPGETPRQAVRRELAEELGIDVDPLRRVGSVRVMDSRHILAVWRVRHVGGEFRPAEDEISAFAWLSAKAIRAVRPTLPSNETVLSLLGL